MNRRELLLSGVSWVIAGKGYGPTVSGAVNKGGVVNKGGAAGVCYEPLIINTTTGWTFDYINRQILRAPGPLPKNYNEDTFFKILQKALRPVGPRR